MNAGRLDQRVTLEGEVRTPDGQGGFSVQWVAKGQAWAMIVGLSGQEALRSLVERSTTTWRVVIRKRADVAPQDRLRWGARILDIKSVMPWPDDPKAALLLICESEAR